MPLLRTAHTELEYLDDGPADGRPVVLVHGFPDEPSTWDEVLALLPGDLRIVRPFLRGVGGSRVADPTAVSGEIAALGTDVLDLISALELHGVLLVGHDWGARAAHAVAVLAPERLTGLLTISTAYGPRTLLDPDELLGEAAVAWYRYWLCTRTGERAFRADPDVLVRWAWDRWSPGLNIPESQLDAVMDAVHTDQFADLVVHYYRHGAGEAAGSAVYAAAQSRLDEWPTITVPSTFVIGTADGCETTALARANGPLFSRGRRLVEVDGGGHFLQRESPEVIAREIRLLLDGTDHPMRR